MNKLDSKKLAKIRKRVEQQNSTKSENNYKEYQESQSRLKKLVEDHGVDAVSVATNLTPKTINQYCRVSVAPSISRVTIEKAELILKDL